MGQAVVADLQTTFMTILSSTQQRKSTLILTKAKTTLNHAELTLTLAWIQVITLL